MREFLLKAIDNFYARYLDICDEPWFNCQEREDMRLAEMAELERIIAVSEEKLTKLEM